MLSADFLHLEDEIRLAESAGADMLHIDVMDGHFVPNITIGPFIVDHIKRCTKLPLDVHLMIEDPDKYLKSFIDAGADYLTVHAEAAVHLNRTINWIKESGIKSGVSINPATPVWALDSILDIVDLVLVMSVNPGFGGQKFIPQSLDKISAIKKAILERSLRALIEVDGGVTPDNAKEVAIAGADIVVMGSAFFGAEDYKAVMSALRRNLGE